MPLLRGIAAAIGREKPYVDTVRTFADRFLTALVCERVIVFAPSVTRELISPVPDDPERAVIDGLARNVLWPMARQDASARTLNRVRLSRSSPLLPYRILFCPLVIDGQTLGFVAALRSLRQPAFTQTELDELAALSDGLRDKLTLEGAAQTALLRRPAFEEEVALRAQSTEIASVVYANLDQIHAINETSGFAAGDQVIRAVGALWRSDLLPHDSIASRLSGDRYAAVLFEYTLNQARSWAERAREAIESMEVTDKRTRITASLGVAVLPRGGSFEHALAAAETACRAAKDRGRNRVEIYETGDESMIRRHNEVRDSRMVLDALEGDHFTLYAQPIVDLASPSVPAHFEILLRVNEADGDLTSIGAYLQAAERYQLLERVDRWVVENTLQALSASASRLQALGVRFAINVTGQSISQPTFAEIVRAELRRSCIAGSLLAFEFTETAAVKNMQETHRFVERMTNAGCHLALDDFGTGVSSLLHLKELAVHQIKIDGKFVADVLTNSRSQALIRALVQIAKELGLETVAEFIENDAVADRVRDLGVQFGQGYLYGSAQPLKTVLESLLAREPRLALTGNG
jgi:diguanylate cyclase (GGDEF)-like protein